MELIQCKAIRTTQGIFLGRSHTSSYADIIRDMWDRCRTDYRKSVMKKGYFTTQGRFITDPEELSAYCL